MQNPIPVAAKLEANIPAANFPTIKEIGGSISQHAAGMFPQAYLLPNGQTATAEFVHAQAAAAAQAQAQVDA